MEVWACSLGTWRKCIWIFCCRPFARKQLEKTWQMKWEWKQWWNEPCSQPCHLGNLCDTKGLEWRRKGLCIILCPTLRILITPSHRPLREPSSGITAFCPGSSPRPISHQQLKHSTDLKAASVYLSKILLKTEENYKRALKGSCKPTCIPRSAELQDSAKRCHISLPGDLASCSGSDLPLLLLGWR